jgi:hypothetical protein
MIGVNFFSAQKPTPNSYVFDNEVYGTDPQFFDWANRILVVENAPDSAAHLSIDHQDSGPPPGHTD